MSAPHQPMLSEEQCSRLLEHSQTRYYRKHQLVCSANEDKNFYFIVTSGCLRVYFTHLSGREFSLSTLDPGSLFTSHASVNIEAIKLSSIAIVEAAMVREIMYTDPTFSMKMMQVVGGMLQTAMHCIESLVFENLECRLADYLLNETSTVAKDPNEIMTPRHEMSVEEIAKFVGSSRQSVSLLLNNWQRAGIVRLSHRRIYIEDSLRLCDIAQRSPDR